MLFDSTFRANKIFQCAASAPQGVLAAETERPRADCSSDTLSEADGFTPPPAAPASRAAAAAAVGEPLPASPFTGEYLSGLERNELPRRLSPPCAAPPSASRARAATFAAASASGTFGCIRLSAATASATIRTGTRTPAATAPGDPAPPAAAAALLGGGTLQSAPP